MKRAAFVLIVLVVVAPALGARGGGKAKGKSTGRTRSTADPRANNPLWRYNHTTGRYEGAKAFVEFLAGETREPFRRFRFDPTKEAEHREERAVVLKMLGNEKLTYQERLTLMRLRDDFRLSGEEHQVIRDYLESTKWRPTAEQAQARKTHETWVPAHAIPISEADLASPFGLRGALAPKVESIRKVRDDIHAFHRGLDVLRRSNWNAQQALADAWLTAKPPERTPKPTVGFGHEGREPPAPPLPAEIVKLLPSNTGESWRRYAHRLLTGQDAITSLAYVDFLYAAALSGAGEFAALAKLSMPRETSPGLSETTSLRQLTAALINDAHVRTSKSVLPHLPRILAWTPPPHRLALALPNTMEYALRSAGKEIGSLHRLPEWQRAKKLSGDIHGFAATSKNLDLYMRHGESLRLLRVDRKSGQTVLFLGEQANAAFREHCRAQVKKYSRPGFRLANVLRVSGGYRIETAEGTLRITNAEFAELERGKSLPLEHALSAALARDPSFVVYSHPLMARVGRYRTEADRVAFALQRSYPKLRVFKDDLSDRTESRARAVQNFIIEKPSDVLILTDAAIDDANIINDIAEEIKESGIKIEELNERSTVRSGKRSRLVIVISGHIDAQLAEFVRRAGGAGYFKNNIVAFNSCASELTSQLVHEINTRYGAVATFRYEGTIPAAKVQDVLMKLNDRIREQPTLDDWKRLVLEEGLTGVWNICLLESEVRSVA